MSHDNEWDGGVGTMSDMKEATSPTPAASP